MNIEGVKKELGERGDHREGVVNKARSLLSIEAQANEELRANENMRRRKIERARKRLERIRTENVNSEKLIEK